MQKAFTDKTYEVPWKVENITKYTLTLKLNFSDP